MGRRKKYNTDEERKAAKREAQKRWREEHKDEIAAKRAEYRANNREKIVEYMTAYNAAHKEEHAAYRSAHKDEIAAYRSTPFGRAIYLVPPYRKADKKYNRGECTIDAQWIVDNVFSGQVCHYCGETDWHKLGCDRKDSSLPHTPENCVPCCKACNDKKNTTQYDEFMRMIGKVI